MVKYLNLTPHEICFHHKDGSVERFPSDGRLVLRPEKRKPYIFKGYPAVKPSSKPTVSGLPAPPARERRRWFLSFLVMQQSGFHFGGTVKF